MTQLALLSTRTTPRTRGECEDGQRPCPYRACRHHLWAEDERPGRPWDGKHPPAKVREHTEQTCALDVADDQEQRDARGNLPRREVGRMLGITGERVRQLEERALEKLRAQGVDLQRARAAPADESSDGAARERVRLPVIDDQMKLPL